MQAARIRELAAVLAAAADCEEYLNHPWHEVLADVYKWEGDPRDAAARFVDPSWRGRHDLILWLSRMPEVWGNADGALVFNPLGWPKGTNIRHVAAHLGTVAARLDQLEFCNDMTQIISNAFDVEI